MENEALERELSNELQNEVTKQVKEDKLNDSNITQYTKRVKIPSKGYAGGPKEVVIRAMTTAEEKILYSSKSFSFIEKIVKACTIEPKVLDMNTLYPADLFYLIYCIRELTFGPTYEQKIKCSECGVIQDAIIDISKFEYDEIPDDVDSKLVLELPICKDRLKLHLITQAEDNALSKEIDRLVQKNKITDVDGFEFIQRLIRSIESVEGVDFNSEEARISYVNKLHAMDVNAIRNQLNKLTFGLKNNCIVTCKSCESEIEVYGTFCPEFFRPTK